MKLVIAEKPSLGRTIASAVGARLRKDGYIEGNGFIVSWCFGHLYELVDPEEYWDPKDRNGARDSWEDSLEHLPFFPADWRFRYDVKRGCRGQVRLLRELINRPDISLIYAAGDADREGEVIVRLVLEANMKTKKRVLRLWLPSLTADVIRKAVAEAKPDTEYDNLYRAGKTRAAVDWMIGIELTRFSSVKAKHFIRIGRCICPIVSRVVEREKEIRDFIPEEYYAVAGEVEKSGIKRSLTCKKRFGKGKNQDAEAYANELNRLPTVVTDIEKKTVELKSGKLFSMSALQSFVCKMDKSLSPSDVLEAAQALYEKGYVTYPRTNSCYLCRDEAGRIDGIISAFRKEGYTDLINKPANKLIYDDSKVESHSAITPTSKIPGSLSGREGTVYVCIKNRFLAVFASVPCIVERTQITVTCGEEVFRLKGDVRKQEGWQKFEKAQEKDSILPMFEKGETIHPGYAPVEKKATPPKRYTVESLNNWMIAPFKKDDGSVDHSDYTDEEWRDILSEATICTEATRADTIDRCLKSKYMTLNKGEYAATEYGFYLVKVMRELGIDLSVSRTVSLSRDLHDISVGKKSERDIFEETKKMLTSIMKREKNVAISFTGGNDIKSIGACPVCGRPVQETKKGFSCTDRSCRFTLWKEDSFFKAVGAKMTKTNAKALLKDGRILAKGLKSQKTGRAYDAYICMDEIDERGYIRWKMEFVQR